MHWRETGFTRCLMRGCGSIQLLRSEFDRIVGDWMRGNTFGTYTHMYGAKVTIKLAEVQGVQECSPESIAAEDADDKVDKLTGND